jgi:hypothetical protein
MDIKVIAKSPDVEEIQGIIPLELALPIIERTLGCTLNWTYSYKADTKKSKLDTYHVGVK